MSSTTRLAKFVPHKSAGEYVDLGPGLRVKISPHAHQWRIDLEATGPVGAALAAAIEYRAQLRAAGQLESTPVEPPDARA